MREDSDALTEGQAVIPPITEAEIASVMPDERRKRVDAFLRSGILESDTVSLAGMACRAWNDGWFEAIAAMHDRMRSA